MQANIRKITIKSIDYKQIILFPAEKISLWVSQIFTIEYGAWNYIYVKLIDVHKTHNQEHQAELVKPFL